MSLSLTVDTHVFLALLPHRSVISSVSARCYVNAASIRQVTVKEVEWRVRCETPDSVIAKVEGTDEPKRIEGGKNMCFHLQFANYPFIGLWNLN